MTSLDARQERWLMVGILLIAAFFRFHAPGAMPPGPSHDELRMMDLGELIVQGQRPLHWKISYSAEPLYMYLLALAMPIWGFTPFGARLVTRFVGLLLIPVVHRLTRRLFDRHVALLTSGLLAVTWWPVFFSRVALRGLTLPLVFTAAVIFLWRGLNLGGGALQRAGPEPRWRWLVVAGALMGLTWYTFTAARGLILLLPMVLVYLGLLGKISLRRLWRVALPTLGIAALVVAPFVYEMQVRPGVPETRLDQLGGIIDRLLVGDLLPFARQAVRSLGLFTVTGDPNWRYNLAGRPILGPVLGLSAMLGLVLSVIRWRQPRYFVLIAWLLLGLAPSMLTPEAPSFVRGIGALPAALVFPAIGAMAVWRWVASRARRGARWCPALALALLLLVNAVATFRSLFITWPAQPEVQAIYQAALTEAFHDLNRSNLSGKLWISEPFPDDRHLLLSKRVLHREALEPRWFNADRALVLPSPGGPRRYLLPCFAEPDQVLFQRWMEDAVVILEGQTPSSGDLAYRVYQAGGGPWVERELSKLARRSTASLEPGGESVVSLPARFGDSVDLLGYELLDDRLTIGQELHLTVYWRVDGPVFEPLASFAHLFDEQNTIVGQYDGFDVPPWHWEPNAVVAQVYRFPVSENARPGTHWLEVGLYDTQTKKRLPVVDGEGVTMADHLVLEAVTLE